MYTKAVMIDLDSKNDMSWSRLKGLVCARGNVSRLFYYWRLGYIRFWSPTSPTQQNLSTYYPPKVTSARHSFAVRSDPSEPDYIYMQ